MTDEIIAVPIRFAYHARPRNEELASRIEGWLREHGREPNRVQSCYVIGQALVTHEYVYDDQDRMVTKSTPYGQDVELVAVEVPLKRELY